MGFSNGEVELVVEERVGRDVGVVDDARNGRVGVGWSGICGPE